MFGHNQPLICLSFRPSKHQSFDLNELQDQEYFEAVEEFGKTNGDCERRYHSCDESLLEMISSLIEEEENEISL